MTQNLVSLVMIDKISPSQFRSIISELTGDYSVSDNKISKETDDRLRAIVNNADDSVLRDSRKNNGQKLKFDKFWEIAAETIEHLQATVVDDRQHSDATQDGDVVVNTSLAISARDLYEQIVEAAKKEGLSDTEMPSLSWFRFQFWPKNPYSHACLINYTGHLKIKYMVQQRNIRKSLDDDYYCAVLYRYLREFSLLFRDYCTMISTNDKNKIKVGEPGCPVAAVTRGKRVLMGQGQVVQVADHDFSNTTIIPTVFLVHNLPPTIDQ